MVERLTLADVAGTPDAEAVRKILALLPLPPVTNDTPAPE